ncbi:MAG TPA: isopeptide-forming domain-containing fimbrial protein [Pyrinomonadaceae bacterium]|nr:isopeptide-forming domain-containing fimbrial protein [Pyrinomonadaceae bacterium]
MSQPRPQTKVRRAACASAKRAWLLVALFCLMCVVQTARAADDTIYGVNFNSPARVLTINPTTGVATTAGTLSFGSAAAAIDPISGNIFYTEYNPFGTSAGRVAYWNPTTGTNTVINSTGAGFQVPRLAFSSSGTLYAMDANNDLYTVDTNDGEFHLLGTVSGVALTSGGDLAFAPNGTLYLLAGGTLYTIDTLTLSGSFVLNTGITSPTGLTFADNNVLYASNLDNSADIYTINLNTGVTTPTSSTAGTLVDDLLSLPKFADLSITKTASSAFIVGGTATYTLTVTNSGPQSAGATVRVRDTLPTGLSYNSASAPGWTCSAVGQVVTCDRATAMGAGVSSTIGLTVNVLATAPSSLNNTATVDSPTFDPSTANNSSTATTSVTVPPDLRITKTHSGNFTQGQANATYTLTVSNNGSGPTVGTVTVTDTLPASMTFVSNGGTGWAGACSASGQVVTCQRSTVLNAGASYPALTIIVSVASDAPASVTNSVTVAVGGELVTNNNSATDATTINGRADLTVVKSHAANFTQGEANATYTITVTNAGRAATTAAITVTDTLPAGLTFVSGSGTGWNACTASGQTVTCTRTASAIAALTSSAITLRVNVSATAPASVTNSVAVSGGGETNTGNNSDTDPTTINQLADLTVNKTHSGNFTQGQANATYTITVTNAGNGATSSTVTVTDTLPAGLSFVSGNGTGWNNCTASGQTVTCQSNAAIAAGASSAITLTVNVASNASASVTNSVAVSGGGEIITNNNSGTDPTTINGVPDLTITKSHSGNFTQGQTNASYTITVTNGGTGPTSGTVTVTDTLPAGLTFASNGGTGWGTCSASGQTVTCQRSDALNAGSSYAALTINVNVSATASASVTNSVSVSVGGETNTGNNSATDPTTITQLADLTITKSHSGNFTRGSTGTYTITVTNSGAAATNGSLVTVTDTLPAGLTPTPWSSNGWSCSISTQTVTCTRSTVLNAGASYPTISIPVNVEQSAASSLTNTASVSGGGQVNTANDSSSDPTTIISSSDLSLTKVTNSSGTGVGSSAVFTITVTNTGPSDATGVAVRDQLPAGLTYLNSTASAGTYNSATGVWSVGNVASGSSPTLQITARIDTIGSITNTAQVTASNQPDPDSTPNNNIATEDDQASSNLSTTPPAISLCKTVLGQPCPPAAINMPPGSDITYVITFTNSGGSFASSFVITDPVPQFTDFKVGTATASLGSTGLSVSVLYSYDGGNNFVPTLPSSGGGGAPTGYDRTVTHVRWQFTGNLSQVAPNNTGNVGFTVRIR